MKFIRTKIPEVVICEPTLFGDERGYFFETFREDKLEKFLGYKVEFCQENESKSSFGVLRGLHYQIGNSVQSKFARVTKGKALDVVVDIRKGSTTFGKYVSVELSEENKRQLFVPRGFAHAILTLSKEAIFNYKVDNYYNPELERGIAFNDKDLNIDWTISENDIILSEKDLNQPKLSELEDFFSIKKDLYV